MSNGAYYVMYKTDQGWMPLERAPSFTSENSAWKWIGKRTWDNITLDVWKGTTLE
jgi:hypothetical protein